MILVFFIVVRNISQGFRDKGRTLFLIKPSGSVDYFQNASLFQRQSMEINDNDIINTEIINTEIAALNPEVLDNQTQGSQVQVTTAEYI